MKSKETGVLSRSEIYFSSPSPTAKKLYFHPISTGHFFCEKNYHLIRDNYDSILVTHIIEGSFIFVLDGVHTTARTGDTVILNCYKPHEYYTNDSFESVWVHIAGNGALDFYNEIVKKEGNVIKCGDTDHVKKMLFRLHESIQQDIKPSEMTMSLDIYKLFVDLSNSIHISTNNNASYEESVEDAKKYIFDHLGDDLKVSTIAEHIHMSPSHFSRVFKQQTGFSPYDFVLVTRLNRAKDYLRKTDMTVSEIAYEVGFNSDANFVYFFTKHTGYSPNKFRKLVF